jgi:hypothetical protein
MNKIQLFILVVLMAYNCYAQPIRIAIEARPEVQMEHNLLHFPGGDSLHDVYFAKMRDLMLFGRGQIRVLHIGGSHIQADIYSNRLRKHLAHFLPNLHSSRGLVFPFKMANTHNPLNYKVQYAGKWTATRNVNRNFDIPLGLAGIAVATTDVNSNFSVHLDAPENAPSDFNLVRVLHTVDSSSYALEWTGKGVPRVEKMANHTAFYFDEPQTQVSFNLQQTDSLQSKFELQGIILDNDRPGFQYSSVGVNGASTWSYLKCVLFAEHLKLIPPDIVFFGIGINDAHDANFSKSSYYKNYEKLMRQFREANPEVLFVFITNNESY